jgi:hypothetical protein
LGYLLGPDHQKGCSEYFTMGSPKDFVIAVAITILPLDFVIAAAITSLVDFKPKINLEDFSQSEY